MTFYEMASSEDGYSLFTLAQMTEQGKGGFPKNATKAIELYNELIKRA
jgi:TPR repeat protein